MYEVILISVKDKKGIEKVKEKLTGRVTALAGNSGVGKTSLINELGNLDEKINEISLKTERGRHTTRHSELFKIGKDTYIFDTPGFSSIEITGIEDKNELQKGFREYKQFFGKCRFNNCIHVNEPGCKVKEYIKNNPTMKPRYDSYIKLVEEISARRIYK